MTGDWQKFKGLPGAEGTLRHAAPKPDKLEVFNKALAEAHAAPAVEAISKKAKKAEKVEELRPRRPRPSSRRGCCRR